MGDVAGVAVKPDHGDLGVSGDEPAVEFDPVGRGEDHVLEVQSPVAGGLKDVAVGKVYEQAVDHVGEPDQ